MVSFVTIKLFSLFNTKAKTNHKGDTRPAPLSVNKLTTKYWNFFGNIS